MSRAAARSSVLGGDDGMSRAAAVPFSLRSAAFDVIENRACVSSPGAYSREARGVATGVGGRKAAAGLAFGSDSSSGAPASRCGRPASGATAPASGTTAPRSSPPPVAVESEKQPACPSPRTSPSTSSCGPPDSARPSQSAPAAAARGNISSPGNSLTSRDRRIRFPACSVAKPAGSLVGESRAGSGVGAESNTTLSCSWPASSAANDTLRPAAAPLEGEPSMHLAPPPSEAVLSVAPSRLSAPSSSTSRVLSSSSNTTPKPSPAASSPASPPSSLSLHSSPSSTSTSSSDASRGLAACATVVPTPSPPSSLSSPLSREAHAPSTVSTSATSDSREPCQPSLPRAPLSASATPAARPGRRSPDADVRHTSSTRSIWPSTAAARAAPVSRDDETTARPRAWRGACADACSLSREPLTSTGESGEAFVRRSTAALAPTAGAAAAGRPSNDRAPTRAAPAARSALSTEVSRDRDSFPTPPPRALAADPASARNGAAPCRGRPARRSSSPPAALLPAVRAVPGRSPSSSSSSPPLCVSSAASRAAPSSATSRSRDAPSVAPLPRDAVLARRLPAPPARPSSPAR